MLTKDQIKSNLQQDRDWTPNDDASEEEWTMYDEVYEALYGGEDTEEEWEDDDEDWEDDDWEEDSWEE